MPWYGLYLNLVSRSLEPKQLDAEISNTIAEPVEKVFGAQFALPQHEAGSFSCGGELLGNWSRKLCWGRKFLKFSDSSLLNFFTLMMLINLLASWMWRDSLLF